jgi:hypothetical protein
MRKDALGSQSGACISRAFPLVTMKPPIMLTKEDESTGSSSNLIVLIG